MTEPTPPADSPPTVGAPPAPTSATSAPTDAAAYRRARTDILGVLAHGSLMSSLRMAADAELAPTLGLKAAMGHLAFREFKAFEDLSAHMRTLDLDPEAAMGPFVAPFSAYHERTRPSDWLEALVKGYVGEGVAKDFYSELAGFVDEPTATAMAGVLDESDEIEFIVPIVRRAIALDPKSVGRLSLWGRRLMGEALSQGQAVAVERDALANLLVGGEADLTSVGEMFARLRARHQERMAQLGLSS